MHPQKIWEGQELGSLAGWQHHLGAGGGFGGSVVQAPVPRWESGPVAGWDLSKLFSAPCPSLPTQKRMWPLLPVSGPGTRVSVASEEGPSLGAGTGRDHLPLSPED